MTESEQRYPTVTRKLKAWFAAHPAETASAAFLLSELDFITREEIILRILREAAWAEEDSRGFRMIPADPSPAEPTEDRPDGEGAGTDSRGIGARLFRILAQETGGSRLGVSVSYLRHLCGNPPASEMERILSAAPWAEKRYGLYRFVGQEEEPRQGEAREEESEQFSILDPDWVPPSEIPVTVRDMSVAAPDGTDGSARRRTEERDGAEQLSILFPDEGREELRVGTIAGIRQRGGYLSVTVDFGPLLGKGTVRVRKACAHLAEGGQVVCGIRTVDGKRVLSLKTVDGEGETVPVTPAEKVRNGERVN